LQEKSTNPAVNDAIMKNITKIWRYYKL
jgi:hypothetical protein